MEDLAAKAIAAAVKVAARFGLRNLAPRLLKDGSNAILHLHPAPVVARVPTTSFLIRKPVVEWLQRDLDLATYLANKGAAVVPPSAELPPGPHFADEDDRGMAMTFWTFVETDRERPVTPEEAAAALPALHAAMRDFPGELPFLGTLLEELPHWLHWLEYHHVLSGADLIALRQAQWELAQQLHQKRVRSQPLHGDAHHRNLLRTNNGLLWTDFEDACTGPVAWDMAVLLSRVPGNAETVRTHYTDAPTLEQMTPFLRARALEAVIYQQVLGRRFPDRAQQGSDALAAWYRQWSLSA